MAQAQQSTAAYLYIDYGADIEANTQNKFFELALAHELWDEDTEPEMMVTEVNRDKAITLQRAK